MELSPREGIKVFEPSCLEFIIRNPHGGIVKVTSLYFAYTLLSSHLADTRGFQGKITSM